MAYNREEFILKEGTLEYGTWTDPSALTPASNPASAFTATDNVGYVRMGSIIVNIADERVEYLSNTPHEIVRRDLLRRNYFWTFTNNQFNATSIALLKNMDVDTGTYNLAWVGPDIPTPTQYGWLFTGERVDGTAFYAAIWSGEVSTDDNNLTFTGTDYVDINVMIQAFPDSNFSDTAADRQQKYGMLFFPASS
jgi:hypothetical protein